uniref:Uncharacterized protein n=1 Tax=Lactuca sativa TaxID=4236 RepID=A0A9R1WB46_LACSA|nr:hypothetical protein LSAT_V11C300148080 [Lactuca sativa]
MMIKRTHPHSFCYLLKSIFFHSADILRKELEHKAFLTSSRAFAAKKAKSLGAKAGNKKAQPKCKAGVKKNLKQEEAIGSSIDDAAHDLISDERNQRRLLDEDKRDMSLDIGPNGRPKKLEEVLPERLPVRMEKEFDESMRDALQKQIVLDGPESCGKSIALAMLVHWARDEGWLVLYIVYTINIVRKSVLIATMALVLKVSFSFKELENYMEDDYLVFDCPWAISFGQEDLSDNQLQGPIPMSNETAPGLDRLKNAKHFHLVDNQLSGDIRSELFRSDMTLIHVIFNNNQLSGKIPSLIGLMSTLKAVRLDSNSLDGIVPQNITNLKSVSKLLMEKTQLQGEIPSTLFQPQLEKILSLTDGEELKSSEEPLAQKLTITDEGGLKILFYRGKESEEEAMKKQTLKRRRNVHLTFHFLDLLPRHSIFHRECHGVYMSVPLGESLINKCAGCELHLALLRAPTDFED